MRDDFHSQETFELLRGGGWYDDALWCRTTSRGGDAPNQGPYDPARGFRVCINLTPRSCDVKRPRGQEADSTAWQAPVETQGVIVSCPVCHEDYEADADVVGEQFSCEVCGVDFTIYDKRLGNE